MIRKVGVIGSGQMGNGIAHVTALSGFGDSSLKRLRLWQAGEPQPDGPAIDRKREDGKLTLSLVVEKQ